VFLHLVGPAWQFTELPSRYNLLLLGFDSAHENQARPDSITVASIDVETGRTVLFSLPRNLQKAPFSQDSPLHAKYPDGYQCESTEHPCMLNTIYAAASDAEELFPGVADPGSRPQPTPSARLSGWISTIGPQWTCAASRS
jgi:anionic cell wall polymer biosynthesis LytR-Cps2A-Psr (LCP) family protein